MVAEASAGGPPAPGKPGISSPSMSARASVGRNGAPGGMVKTRGSRIGMESCHAGRRGRQAGLWTASRSRAQPRREPLPIGFLAGNAETQAIGRVGEGARQNARREQALEGCSRVQARGETEELCSTDDAPAVLRQQRVEPRRFA